MIDAAIDPAVLDLISKGETILFIGAGFSLIPIDPNGRTRDRKGLKEALIEKYRGSLNDASYDLNTMSMEDIVFYLQVRKGISRHAIANTLCSFLTSSDELVKLESFTLLRSLLTFRPKLFESIITTNWDKGIEASLTPIKEVRVNPLVTDKDYLKYSPAQLSILKIHGDIDDPDSIILSSQDFDVYEKEHPRIVERLRILFSTKYVILLGYAARDENFRRIYRSLHHDLGGTGLRGGYIVSPSLQDRERLWSPTVNLNHVPVTAQSFLAAVLSHVARVPLGISNPNVSQKSFSNIRFESDLELNGLALKIKRQYSMREVWVAKLRDAERPNQEIGQVASFYIETRCSSAKSLAISTGETMSALAESLDVSAFRNRITVSPTIVLLAGPRGFKDPSQVAQTLVSRFDPKRAECMSLRLPDESYLSRLFPRNKEKDRNSLMQAIRTIGMAQVAKALESDVIISSLRPPDWFGSNEMPRGRTIPIQGVPGIPIEKLNAALRQAGVVAVTQMIPLDAKGKDVASMAREESPLYQLNKMLCRPSVEQLRKAAASKRRVIIVASHIEKLSSLKVLLQAKLCNVLILDESLANTLLDK